MLLRTLSRLRRRPTVGRITIVTAIAVPFVATAILAAITPAALAAQESTLDQFTMGRDTYTVRRWTTDSGLPSNMVLDIAQTPDGYLWIATNDGLTRFDGRRFVEVAIAIAGEPGNLRAYQVEVDRAGTVWVELLSPTDATEHRLARRVDDHWEIVHRYEGLSGAPVLAVDPQGALWFQMPGAVGRWHRGRVEAFEVPDIAMNGLVAAASGAVWVATTGPVIVRIEGGELTRFDLPGRPGVWGVTALHEDAEGGIWVGTLAGLAYGPGERFESRPIPGQGPVDQILSAEAGNLWVTRPRTPLIRASRPGGRSSPDQEAFNLTPYSLGTALSSFADAEGNHWFGLLTDGLAQLRKNPLPATLNIAADPFNPNFVWLGAPRTAESLWAAENCSAKIMSADAGRFILTEGFPPAPTLQQSYYGMRSLMGPSDPDCVRGIVAGGDGALWFLRGGYGVTRLEDDVAMEYPYPTEDAAGAPIDPEESISPHRLLITDTLGRPWYVGRGRHIVSVALDGVQTAYRIEGDPEVEEVLVLRPGSNGDVWFGSAAGFGRLSEGVMTRWRSEEWLSGEGVTDIHVDPTGAVWVSSRGGGLLYIDGGTVTRLTRADGLLDDRIIRILETDAGDLWLLSGRGVMVVRRRHVVDYIEGAVDVLDVGLLGRRDGAPEFRQPMASGVKGVDGRIWLVGAGVSVVDPAEIRGNDAAPVVIVEGVTVDGAPLRGTDVFVIEPGARSIEIDYTVPTFVDPDRLRFRRRLDGQDDAWSPAEDRRLASYSNLSPGDYTFRVIARKNFGEWSDAETVILIRVLPAWWQTNWFLVLSVLGVMALGAAIQALRTRRVRRQNIVLQREIAARTAAEIDLTDLGRRMITAQEDDRARIARELHDDISQRLAAASIGIEISKTAIETDPGGARNQLDGLQGQIDRVSEDVRLVSHQLHPEILHNLGLTTALEAMCEDFQAQTGVTIRSTFTGPIDEVGDEIALCIYRVSQEALHNVAKHAAAATVELDVLTTQSGVRFSLQDDGTGFDAARPQTGLGLASMRERARLLGGAVQLRSASATGTKIIVKLPR